MPGAQRPKQDASKKEGWSRASGVGRGKMDGGHRMKSTKPDRKLLDRVIAELDKDKVNNRVGLIPQNQEL